MCPTPSDAFQQAECALWHLEPCPHSAYANFGELGILTNPIVEAILVPDVHRICGFLNSMCVFVWWRHPGEL